MYKAIRNPSDGDMVQFLGVHALSWPTDIEPTMAFNEVDEWTIFESAVKAMTLIMEQIESGSPRWVNRGGQSYGWKLFNWTQIRYDVPESMAKQIKLGFLRWITL